nr:MAG TPA: hypothetical protein [Caudoviricetes sp.]
MSLSGAVIPSLMAGRCGFDPRLGSDGRLGWPLGYME